MIGGTGFLGSAIVRELARRPASADCCFTLPTRRREKAKHLLVLPTVRVVDADVHDPATLARLMAGQDAVISLVGILKGGEGEPYGKGFARAHVELPRKIAAAAKAAGVRRVLHVSALKAAADAPSGYLRSKAAGEATLRDAGLDLTLFRPSVIFGRGDSFLTLFARMAMIAPFFPLAGAEARFQPVWVEDVAAAVADSLSRSDSIGARYDLCGPTQYSLRQLVSYAASVSGHPRAVIGLPHGIAWLQAWAMEFIPNGPMTRDNIRSMQVASVCDAGCALPFGRKATPLESVAPMYLRN
ncbi:complex I NDUFA9 subunit family protein [Sulfuritalea hydrogenivorans]|uniref:Nucleoside-diphosphate-sugar epimerase n=1 Tax=Sulfuritalea hydrogenivorans sk43H TaxID=1223802 RepID=W0SNG0_9PROT|nr:complex I NDUFA9 subunit family protein [Sulfuritalea hydrogenivorans]BAO31343.1 nucleoside-diphosphate-sugar epimerase [Sulfuritalea hydrogenivorans sk43H]